MRTEPRQTAMSANQTIPVVPKILAKMLDVLMAVTINKEQKIAKGESKLNFQFPKFLRISGLGAEY
jgi:hypothetical protein